MLITSRFNPKGLRLQLVLFLLAPLALFAPALGSRKDIIITIAVIGVMIAIAACIWAFLLKTITVMDQELEVKHTCLPFLKRYYRLAEFDSYIIEEEGIHETFCLLIQGKRAVKLSSKIYENYEELKQGMGDGYQSGSRFGVCQEPPRRHFLYVPLRHALCCHSHH